MSDWSRRSVLATAAALSTGALASAGAAGGERAPDLPDPGREPTPDLNAAWPSHRGGAGHARYVADGPAFEDGTVEAVWSVDHHDEIAVADGIVYATIDHGVVALDAADGALVWENPDVAATAPSVDGERVFLTGTEVVALNRADGRVRWRTDFGTDERAAWQTVAYGGVYVVVNETLYALDPDDGTVRWDVTPDGEDAFVAGTAAANGVVYAATDGAVLAYDPETGEEVWRRESEIAARGAELHANATAVVSAGGSEADRRRYDARTGAVLETASDAPHEVALGESVAVAGTNDSYRGRPLADEGADWVLEAADALGPAAVGGDTVYVTTTDDEGQRRLVALDERDGSERWSVAESEVSVGPIRAITEDTIYVASDGDLVALRERSTEDEEDARDGDDRDGDGRDGDSEENGDDEDRDDSGGDDEDPQNGDDESSDGRDRDRDDGGNDSQPDDGVNDSQPDDGGNDSQPDDGVNEEPDGEETTDEDADRDGDATDSDGEVDSRDEPAGGTETDDDGDATGDDTAERDDEPVDTDTNGSEAEPESTDDGGTAAADEADDVPESSDDEPDGGTEPEDVTDDPAETDAEGTPGFTTGAGLAGGVLGLEWLRRRASTEDEPNA